MPKSKMTVKDALKLKMLETEKMIFYGHAKSAGESIDGISLQFVVTAIQGKRDLQAERYLAENEPDYDGNRCYHGTAFFDFLGDNISGASFKTDSVTITVKNVFNGIHTVYLQIPLGNQLEDRTPKEDAD